MSTERRNCTTSDPQVTRRLFIILVLMIGFTCIFGAGYMLGRMERNELKRNQDQLLTFNLTVVTDSLFKKAKRISPKAVHHHDAEKVRSKLSKIFDCNHLSCCTVMDDYNIADYIRTCLNFHVAKLMKSVNNASSYLEKLG